MAEQPKIVLEVDGFQCQICEAVWIPKVPGKKPRRCPNVKCRSRRWDKTKYPNVPPPSAPEDGNGGGINRRRGTCYRTLLILRAH